MRQIMTEETASNILADKLDEVKAQLFRNNTNAPFAVQTIVIPLTTARNANDPYIIKVPFKSIYVQDATDVNTTVNVRVMSTDTYQSSFIMRKNDVIATGSMINQIALDWSAQSGKTITFVFFTDAEFRSGSQISVTGGGVFLSEGSSFTDSVQALTAATAAIVFPSDSTRALGIIQNLTGLPIYVGPSTVTASGATIGYEVAPNATYEWRNTAVLYAISTPGGNIFKRIQN